MEKQRQRRISYLPAFCRQADLPAYVGMRRGLCPEYLFGTEEPLKTFEGKVTAVWHRFDDVEDKWIVSLNGEEFTDEKITGDISFQEQFFMANCTGDIVFYPDRNDTSYHNQAKPAGDS